MWSWILSDEGYTELYHQYFEEFLDTVDIQAIINHAYTLIKEYVAKDPSAFYTYEEFEVGVETMRQFCALRSESISMQLENGETTSNMNYVDASGLTLSSMGSMGGSKGGFGGGEMPTLSGVTGDFRGRKSSASTNENPDAKSSATTELTIPPTSTSTSRSSSQSGNIPGGFDPSQMQGGFGGQMPDMGNIPEGFAPSQMQGSFGGQMPDMGNIPGGFDPSQMQGGFGGQMPDMGNIPGGFDPSQMQGGNNVSSDQSADETDSKPSDNSTNPGTNNSNRPSRDNMQIPGGSFGTGINGMSTPSASNPSIVWLIASVLVLGVGLIIAKIYR